MTEKRIFMYPVAPISIDEVNPGFAFDQSVPENDLLAFRARSQIAIPISQSLSD